MDLKALVRRITRLTGDQQPSLGEFGELLVSQLLPRYSKLALAGKLFSIDMSAGTAIAPVTAAPVDSPQWGYYNFSNTEVMIPLHVATQVTVGTPGGFAIYVATAVGKQTEATVDYSGTIKTAADGSNRSPDVYLVSNVTLIGGTPAWDVVAQTPSVVANVGNGLNADLDKYVVRPGGKFAVEIVGGAGTTPLYDVHLIFAMIDADFY